MNESLKGYAQAIAVVAFIVGTFVLSEMLQVRRTPPQQNEGAARSMVAQTQSVAIGNYALKFTTSGSVAARNPVSVVPQASGYVVDVHEGFYAGGAFKAGDVLFRIDPKDARLAVQRAEAQVAQAQTALELEDAEAGAAAAEWALLNGSRPAPDLVMRKPQALEARANLRAANATLAEAQLALDRTKVTMPFDGRVVRSGVEAGQFVAVGQSYGEVFSLETLEVQATLDDTQLEWLLGAQAPEIAIVSAGGQRFKGELKRGVANFDTQTRLAGVRFGFADGQDVDLLPGSFVDVRVTGSDAQNVAVIPAASLQRDGRVWGVDEADALVAYTPEVVLYDGENVVVRGLPSGARIVVHKLAGASAGMKIAAADAAVAKDAAAKDAVKEEPQAAPEDSSLRGPANDAE